MCHSSCPYEYRFSGDCGRTAMQNTPLAHCYTPKCQGCGEEGCEIDEIYGLCNACWEKEREL